jgi:hypothetical protein
MQPVSSTVYQMSDIRSPRPYLMSMLLYAHAAILPLPSQRLPNLAPPHCHTNRQPQLRAQKPLTQKDYLYQTQSPVQ